MPLTRRQNFFERVKAEAVTFAPSKPFADENSSPAHEAVTFAPSESFADENSSPAHEAVTFTPSEPFADENSSPVHEVVTFTPSEPFADENSSSAHEAQNFFLESKHMQIIGVRLKKAGKILFFEPDGETIVKGDWVIVETVRGLECGQVVVAPRELSADENLSSEPGLPLQKIYRKATDADLRQVEDNHAGERRAFEIGLQKIKEHDLPMKLINVEFTFDVNKIIFFFTADGRVDFRDLVRDLASIFRTRIELRQVGVRDEAKLLGGMGGCGRPLCCATFLGDFIPVSIRMAKDQNLSLNPTKISGVCGRLMCCLKYENDLYCENCPRPAVTFKPRVGSRVVVADGEGKVVAVSFSRRNATILLDTNKTVVTGWEDILPVNEEDMDAAFEPAQAEEIKPIEPPQSRAERQPHRERSDRRERRDVTEHRERASRTSRTESFNRRYNRPGNSERDTRPERPTRPRGDRARRQPRRDPKR